ncbi:lamin tail domain-containing protein [Ardenticatena maritima]|nr:lamin tail domain-containing protein [Ardenticatena maritima]
MPEIVIQFNQPMNDLTINTTNILLSTNPSGAQAVPATVAYDPGTQKAYLRPLSSLSPGTTYHVIVKTLVQNAENRNMGVTVKTQFTTCTSCANTPPQAKDIIVYTYEGRGFVLDATFNAFDAEFDPIRVSSATCNNGTVVTSERSIWYTPALGTYTDTCTFTLTDNIATSNTASLTVYVRQKFDTRQVIFNEIMWGNGDYEYIELKNPDTTNSVVIRLAFKITVSNSDATPFSEIVIDPPAPAPLIPATETILLYPGAYYLIERQANSTDIAGDILWGTDRLSDSGALLELFDVDENFAAFERANRNGAWYAGSSTTSMARTGNPPDDGGLSTSWCTSALGTSRDGSGATIYGTPRERNNCGTLSALSPLSQGRVATAASPTPMPLPTQTPVIAFDPLVSRAPRLPTHRDARAPVRLSEVRTYGVNGADDEFIELYNQSNESIDLEGWSIWVSAHPNLASRWFEFPSVRLLPGQHLLLAGPGYHSPIPPDLVYTTGIPKRVGIALVEPDGLTIADEVGWTAQTLFGEGTPLDSSYAQTFFDGAWGRRSDGAYGLCRDTNDNARDFVWQLATPQNRHSGSGMCNALSIIGPTPQPHPTLPPVLVLTSIPTRSPTPTNTPTPGQGGMPTPTYSPLPMFPSKTTTPPLPITSTPTPTPTPTSTPIPMSTPTPTPTNTPTLTNTSTPTSTPTNTPTPLLEPALTPFPPTPSTCGVRLTRLFQQEGVWFIEMVNATEQPLSPSTWTLTWSDPAPLMVLTLLADDAILAPQIKVPAASPVKLALEKVQWLPAQRLMAQIGWAQSVAFEWDMTFADGCHFLWSSDSSEYPIVAPTQK